MRRAPLLAFITLVLLTGGAAACDLAGPAPGPGHFYIFDVKTGAETRIDVQGRWLGAGCELSNPFAYDGSRFTWSEGPERSDAKQTVYLRQSDGTRTTLPIPADQVQSLGLTATHVYYLEQTSPTATIGKMRISDRDIQNVPLEAPFHAMLSGVHVGWFTNDGERVNVYDAADQEWVLRDKTLSDLTVPGHDLGQLHALNERYALFSTYLSTQKPTTTYRYWTYDFDTDRLHEIVGMKDPRSSWIDGQTLDSVHYGGEGLRLESMSARGGTVHDHGGLPHELGKHAVVTGSKVVLASYTRSAPHTHSADPDQSGWRTSPSAGQESWSVPGAPWIFVLAAMSLAVALSRPR